LEVYKKANVEVIRNKFAINSDTVISFVGRIDKEKGLETLIKAFALLLKNGASTQLLIAGKPINNGEDYQKSLEQLVIDLGIEERVNFIGHVTDTTSVYQVSDLTVLPSLWSEPFGRTIVESMACGTPVVASRIGGIPEILTGEFQNGLFTAGDEQDLSIKLEQMINWREREPLLGTRCREHILAKFSLSKMIDGIEKVLKKRFRPTLAPSPNPLKV
ncbi:MAG: glycosyltransferase, partial [Nostocaceae cyanobacterium]|nr:glycosyltransferase [Nostocaceae cyanobacterium]